MRVYVEDRYRGLQYRQRRVYLRQEPSEDIRGDLFRGSVYEVKNLSRDGTRVLQPVDRQVTVECRFTPLGLVAVDRSNLPLRTGFPVLPGEEVSPGDSWEADGTDSLSIDDGDDRISTPFHCTYIYRGESAVMERPAQMIEFEYGYNDASPYTMDSHEVRGRGTGQINLFLDDEGGYFINERLIRHFLDSRGRAVRREEGFRLTWGRGITYGEMESLSRKLTRVLGEIEKDREDPLSGESGANGGVPGGEDTSGDKIRIEETVEGIRLSLPKIHFYPDEARILSSEKNRLDRLARLLQSVPEADFLIKGHTADVGTKESQYILSVERTKTILREMEQRGLKTDRFIYQGLGGDEPVASNDTEEGRAQNRRVEVIILND